VKESGESLVRRTVKTEDQTEIDWTMQQHVFYEMLQRGDKVGRRDRTSKQLLFGRKRNRPTRNAATFLSVLYPSTGIARYDVTTDSAFIRSCPPKARKTLTLCLRMTSHTRAIRSGWTAAEATCSTSPVSLTLAGLPPSTRSKARRNVSEYAVRLSSWKTAPTRLSTGGELTHTHAHRHAALKTHRRTTKYNLVLLAVDSVIVVTETAVVVVVSATRRAPRYRC